MREKIQTFILKFLIYIITLLISLVFPLVAAYILGVSGRNDADIWKVLIAVIIFSYLAVWYFVVNIILMSLDIEP